MIAKPSKPAKAARVRGLVLTAEDSREEYRRKLARIALDSLVQFVGLLDVDGTVLEINQATLDAAGIVLSDVEGKPFSASHWWQVSEEANAPLRDAIKRAALGEVVRWDAPIRRRADGEDIGILDISLAPVRDDQGQVVFIAVQGHDITERETSTRELARRCHESESHKRLYETVLSNTPDLVYVFGRDHRFTFANQALLNMWGRTLEQSVGKSLLEIGYEPWHAAMHEREIEQVIATKKPVRGEVSFPHATLGRRIYDYIFAPVINADGEVESVAGTTRDITDRNLAEEALRQRTAQFETLLNEAPMGVYLIDSNFRISAVNPTAKPFFGVIPDLIGRDFDEVIHILWAKDYADELVRRFRHTLQTGEPHITLESGERRRDRGVDEFYEWRISRIPLPDGRFGVVCYFRDISAQVQARKEMAESEMRFRAMVNASSDVVYRMNPDWSELLDLRGRDFIADTEDPSRTWLKKYIHPDDQTNVMQAAAQAVKNRSVFELEHRVLRLDGTVGWIFSRAIPLFDGDGEIVEWFGAASDVTGRKLAQEALRESEARFRLIVESAQDFAIFTADFEGRVTSWNSGAERILGYAAGEILGRSGAVLFTPEDQAAGWPDIEMRTALAEGNAESERWHVHKGGSLFWASGLMMPLRGEGGSVRGFLKILRDHTDKRREEEQRKLLLDELNHRVKNTLSTVQSVAMRTMRSVRSPMEFQQAFGSRLMALSQAHDLLTRGNWLGAELGDVVRQTLSPYFDRTERRVKYGGVALKLRPNAAVMLNLVLHELATNAAKYGALSKAAGQVSVTWTIDHDGRRGEAEILWQESGGPLVQAPSRTGFGATLIRRGVSEELEGDVELEFASSGVTCRIRFPIEENVVVA